MVLIGNYLKDKKQQEEMKIKWIGTFLNYGHDVLDWSKFMAWIYPRMRSRDQKQLGIGWVDLRLWLEERTGETVSAKGFAARVVGWMEEAGIADHPSEMTVYKKSLGTCPVDKHSYVNLWDDNGVLQAKAVEKYRAYCSRRTFDPMETLDKEFLRFEMDVVFKNFRPELAQQLLEDME